MSLDISRIISSLSSSRKLFHSEADFQFALAWKIQTLYPDAKIRLEYINHKIENMHIDILINLHDEIIPIELKYVTKSLTCSSNGEEYFLKNHGAQDLRRYDLFRDIERIEYCKNKFETFKEGYVIMITNDQSYYRKYENNRITNCHDFRIHDGVLTQNYNEWKNNPSYGTIRGRENPIILKNNYYLEWNQYSIIDNVEFKILVVKVV